MKKVFLIVILVFFVGCLHAKSREVNLVNVVSGFYIGEFGWVYSKINMTDNQERKNIGCYKKINGFEIENWTVEFGAPCERFEQIQLWLFKDNSKVFNIYRQNIAQLKKMINYMYSQSPEFDLQVVLIDQESTFVKSYHHLVHDSIPLNTFGLVNSENFTETEVDKINSYLISTISHEFFHLYQRRYKSHLTKAEKKVLRKNRNNEALAKVLERCGSFAIGAAGFEVLDHKALIEQYLKNPGSQSIYDKTFKENPISAWGVNFNEANIGYSLGTYALWDQFGTDVQPFEKSKISDMLKFCRYVVQTIPDVKELREIELSDYLPMPRPDFYWDNDSLKTSAINNSKTTLRDHLVKV